MAGVRRMPFCGKGRCSFTLVLDEFSAEIFVDGRAMSSTIYPPEGADGVELEFVAASGTVRLEKIR